MPNECQEYKRVHHSDKLAFPHTIFTLNTFSDPTSNEEAPV